MKYKAIFDVTATVKKQNFQTFEANASVKELTELRALLPTDADIKKNNDLLFCSFNLAVAGLINANNHGILPETALKMIDSFKWKPMNVEHNRSENIGVITEVGFSTFPDSKLINSEMAAKTTEPFHLSIGAVVWKIASPWFASYLENTNDPTNEWDYKSCSTSWEVGFDEFVIARGSRNLFDAEIITDEAEVKRLSQYLTQMGGTGFDDHHKEVYMVISGNPRGLGGGFTSNPAAAVSGVYIPDIPEKPEEKEDESSVEVASVSSNERNVKENIEKISQPTKIIVKRINHMKFTDLDNFVDKYSEAIAKNEAIATSDVRDFIKESLVKNAETWQSKVTEQEEKAEAAQKKVSELQAAVDIAKDDAKTNADAVAALKKELDEVKAKAEETAQRQAFDSRMSKLDGEYDLSEKVRSVIAKSILGKSDDEFTEWLANEGEVILAGKEKKEVSVEEALKTATASADLPNASAPDVVKEVKPLKPTAKAEGGSFVISFN